MAKRYKGKNYPMSKKGSMKKEYAMKGMKGYKMGEMKAEVMDWQSPDAAFAGMHDQAPLDYYKRREMIQAKEAAKIRSQKFEGRY